MTTIISLVSGTAAALAPVLAAYPELHLYAWRSAPLQDLDLPAVLLYALNTTDDDRSMSNPELRRRTDTLTIDVQVSTANDTWAPTLSAYVEAIKGELLNNETWLTLSNSVGTVKTTYGVEMAGDSRRAGAVLTIDLENDAVYAPLASTAVDLTEVREVDSHGANPETQTTTYKAVVP